MYALSPITVARWAYLLVALLIAVLVTAAVAVIWVLVGAGIGEATASDSSPSGDPTGSSTSAAITVGAYVSVMGNLVTGEADVRGANAIYFSGWIPDAQAGMVTDETQTNGNGTTIFGQSTGTPDFCFTDPDANISLAIDPCMCKSL
jgi:hypothetical protein